MGGKKGGVEVQNVRGRPVRESEQGAKRESPELALSQSYFSVTQRPVAFTLCYSTLDQHKEMSSNLRQQLNESGFVVVQHFLSLIDRIQVEGLLEEPWLTKLREASERVVERARAGPDDPLQWKYVRAVGKQFPPFPTDRDDIWGVQHLIHPDLHEPVFLDWYTSPKLLATVCEIIGASQDDLQLELFNLLINPRQIPYSLTWHRDNVRCNYFKLCLCMC